MSAFNFRFLFLLLAFWIVAIAGGAQTLQTMDSLATANQECLDRGVDMMGCSKRYFMSMDSVLNVVYNDMLREADETQKAILKKEQIKWLKRSQAHHAAEVKEYRRNVDAGDWGTDMFMVVYEHDAAFVRNRVTELIRLCK